ncbi:protein translocase subunit SecF [Christensenellaceae bacterium OttesenSCG-928-L17]|nr:protein translocase subunit SecF [Christensenellaceae bacterium OttesenSCG-928-L17]
MQYTKKLKISLSVSAAIIVVGLVVGLISGGMNIGIDFTGGMLVTVQFANADFDMDVVEAALDSNNIVGAQAVRTGNTTSNQNMANIRMKSLNDDEAESAQRTSLLESIQETYPDAQIISVDRVDGVASKSLVQNAVLSILIASALILLYIWFRFELLSGVAAVVCLLHDVIVMLAITCMLRIPINSSFIAAVLTIVGYSINNTIIIFDRIRENSKHAVYAEKNREEIVNKSISSTLRRSINTSLTTLMTIGMVYILGVESIKEFSLPIIVGLIAGTYSSIFLAGPLWARWSIARFDKMKFNAKSGGGKRVK